MIDPAEKNLHRAMDDALMRSKPRPKPVPEPTGVNALVAILCAIAVLAGLAVWIGAAAAEAMFEARTMVGPYGLIEVQS